MKKNKTITDPEKLVKVLNSLRPMSARLLLHFLLTEKPWEGFLYTLHDMSLKGNIKNPQRAIAEILDFGYMTRGKNYLGNYVYIIHLDLVE